MHRTLKLIVFTAFVVATLFLAEPAEARYDPSVIWRTVRNDNVTIYYPAGSEAFASRILSLSPNVYADNESYFGVEPRRLAIVLHPGTDLFNGFYSAFPNRISLFETPVDDLKYFGSETSDIVDLVYTHELAHYIHITTSRGLVSFLSRFLGEGIRVTNAFAPGWAVEGLATEIETEFTDGGRGRSHFFRGVMRSFGEDGELWGLSASGTVSPFAPPYDRIYYAGFHMVDYVNRVYGGDAFSRLSSYQAAHPLRGFRGALKSVTGVTNREFYRGFLDDFSARSDSVRTEIQSRNLPDGNRLIGYPLDNIVSHFWTADGTIMALRSGYDGKSAIIEIDPDSGDVISERFTGRLPVRSAVRGMSDGRLILCESFYHPFGDGDLNVTDLVLFDPETRQHERLTRNAHLFSADVSPDGSRFAAVRRTGMWTGLVLVDHDGGNFRPLMEKEGLLFEAPVWSPDGGTIASTLKKGSGTGIALVDPSTGECMTLFDDDNAGEGDPVFSPDGRWLVFASDREDAWNIYAWDLTEERLYRLTSVFTCALEPRISPDGGTLSFIAYHNGVREIRTIPFEPENGRPVVYRNEGVFDTRSKITQSDLTLPESDGIPLWEAYRPFLHTPYAKEDRDGIAYGAFIMGGDPVNLNRYSAALFYEPGTGHAGYSARLVNRSFWPDITANVYNFDRKDNGIDSGDKWYRERGEELSVSLDVINRAAPTSRYSFYVAGLKIRHFDLPDDMRHDTVDRSISLFGEMIFEDIPDAAPRDMVPGWGRAVFIKREDSFDTLGYDIKGYNTLLIAKQYAPSPVKHHGFEFTAALQHQRGALSYSKSGSRPRGYSSSDRYGGLNLRKTFTMFMDYRFPIMFIDRGFGVNFLHLHLLRGSLFFDNGAGWHDGFDLSEWGRRSRSSFGATMSMQTSLFSYIPFEFGLVTGYMPREKKPFTRVMIDLYGYGFAAKNNVMRAISFLPLP